MLDQIPTEVTYHSKAPTDGVSSSDVFGGRNVACNDGTYPWGARQILPKMMWLSLPM